VTGGAGRRPPRVTPGFLPRITAAGHESLEG